MQPSEFYSQYLPYAQSVSQRTGLDPRLVLAQAALESGWGKSAPNGNFFGIKSHGRPNGQTLVTSEYENGQYVPQEASFRTYAGPEQSFYDYGSFILDNPRYQPVMDAGDLQGQIAAMGASGYATDPEYSRKLSRIVGMFGGDGGNMQQPQQQQGLLGAAPQGNRRGDLAGAMAVAFNELRQRPSAAVPAMVEANRTRRAGNRTAEWLRGQPGGEAYAQMIDNGANAAQVVAAYQKASAGPEYRQATGAELGMSPEFANQVFNVGADGKVTAIGGGGTNVTNILPGGPNAEDELRKQLMGDIGETWAGYSKAGGASAAAMSDLDVLQEIADLSPSGAISGRLAEMFPEANDVSALRQSIVTRVGPTLRAEGSGSTSDIEYAGMINSLGSLRNTPEANKAIIAVMQSQAQFNIDRAAVIKDYASQKISYTEASEKLAALDAGSRIPEQVKAIIDNYSDATTEGGGLTVGTIEDGYRYNGGPPHLESSWEAVK